MASTFSVDTLYGFLPGTPLEDHRPTPTWREHRLYQADFLLRQYGFRSQDLGFGLDGNLPRDRELVPRTGLTP